MKIIKEYNFEYLSNSLKCFDKKNWIIPDLKWFKYSEKTQRINNKALEVEDWRGCILIKVYCPILWIYRS